MPADALRVTAQLPGSALKWIGAAGAELKKRNIKLDYYNVTLVDQANSVVVILTSLDVLPPQSIFPLAPKFPPGPLDPPLGTRGSFGELPGFEVEIGKQDMLVIRSNYVK